MNRREDQRPAASRNPQPFPQVALLSRLGREIGCQEPSQGHLLTAHQIPAQPSTPLPLRHHSYTSSLTLSLSTSLPLSFPLSLSLDPATALFPSPSLSPSRSLF